LLFSLQGLEVVYEDYEVGSHSCDVCNALPDIICTPVPVTCVEWYAFFDVYEDYEVSSQAPTFVFVLLLLDLTLERLPQQCARTYIA
jgi:hypothetical protein